jgi:hypothetical protein
LKSQNETSKPQIAIERNICESAAEQIRAAGVLKMEEKPETKNHEKVEEKPETKDREDARKPYESPKLVVHGSLTRLTAGSNSGAVDALATMALLPPFSRRPR